VKFGRTLVVDEADKAPLEVVVVLKGLVEDQEMILSDGRRIVPMGTPSPPPQSIPIHPKFRMIVLANRPGTLPSSKSSNSNMITGYPFLGNDFFAECGDCFSW
jgi:hypothetical protein